MRKNLVVGIMAVMVTAGVMGCVIHNNGVRHEKEMMEMQEMYVGLEERYDNLAAEHCILQESHDELWTKYNGLAEKYRNLDDMHTGLESQIENMFNGEDYTIHTADGTVHYSRDGLKQEASVNR